MLLLDGLDVAHRDAGVLLAEVHLGWALGRLVDQLDDVAAVVAHRPRKPVRLGGGQERYRAAQAEADDADRSLLLELVDRRLRVAQHGGKIRIGHELAGIGDLVGRIAAFEARLRAVEQGRGDGDETFGRQPIADRADVAVDAENLLNDHDAAHGRALRIGPIGAQLVLVGGGEPELLAHVTSYGTSQERRGRATARPQRYV